MSKLKSYEKFEKSSKDLDDLLSSHKASSDISGLGFKGDLNYDDIRQEDVFQSKKDANMDNKRSKPILYPNAIRYDNYFNGHCYVCNEFGHRARDYRRFLTNEYPWSNGRNRSLHQSSGMHHVVFYNFHQKGHIVRFCLYKSSR